MKAVTPSVKSSVRSSGSSCRKTWCTFCSNVSVSAARIIRLIARTASGALPAISAANSLACFVSSPAGHDPVDEAEFERLVGGQRPAGERDLGGLRVADHARQQPRAAALGQDAALGEAGVELGRVGGDADVAPEREVEAVAGGAAVQRAHGRRVDVVQHDRRGVAELELAGERLRAAEVAEPALRAGHLGLQVEAGAERPALAGEHDAAHVRIAVGLEQPGGDLAAASTRRSCSSARERRA